MALMTVVLMTLVVCASICTSTWLLLRVLTTTLTELTSALSTSFQTLLSPGVEGAQQVEPTKAEQVQEAMFTPPWETWGTASEMTTSVTPSSEV